MHPGFLESSSQRVRLQMLRVVVAMDAVFAARVGLQSLFTTRNPPPDASVNISPHKMQNMLG